MGFKSIFDFPHEKFCYSATLSPSRLFSLVPQDWLISAILIAYNCTNEDKVKDDTNEDFNEDDDDTDDDDEDEEQSGFSP